MPHRRNIDIDLLRSFVTIVEVRSFTRAAERLLRTQSAISLQMKRLEEQLGCRLFERGGRGVEPTEAGELLLGFARRILAANDELVGRMAEPLVEGEVGVWAPEAFAAEHLAPALARFGRAFPRVRIIVVAGAGNEGRAALAAGTIDLLLVSTVGPLVGAEPLMSEPLVWCVAEGAEPAAPATGDRLALVVPTAPCPIRAMQLARLDEAGIGWRIAFESPSRSGVQAALGAGLGVGVLPRSSMLAGLHRLNHHQRLPTLPALETGLAVREGASFAARRLAVFLAHVFTGEPRDEATIGAEGTQQPRLAPKAA